MKRKNLVTPTKQIMTISGLEMDSGALYQSGNSTPAPLISVLDMNIPKNMDSNCIVLCMITL